MANFPPAPNKKISYPKLKKEFLNVSIYLNLNDCTIKLFIIIKFTAAYMSDYVFQFSNLTKFIQ